MTIVPGVMAKSAPFPAELRPLTSDDFDAAMAIALSLPEWFNEIGIKEIMEALPQQAGAVAEVDGDVVGWVTWASEGDLGEIAWIAVSPDQHRHGIGARLIKCAEDRLRHSGVTTVEVETLGESV
jgi:ribosomal protein S18 acetylase RimI-like enzyme